MDGCKQIDDGWGSNEYPPLRPDYGLTCDRNSRLPVDYGLMRDRDSPLRQGHALLRDLHLPFRLGDALLAIALPKFTH